MSNQIPLVSPQVFVGRQAAQSGDPAILAARTMAKELLSWRAAIEFAGTERSSTIQMMKPVFKETLAAYPIQ